MNSKRIYTKVLGLALAALTFTACSDTWDDHYEGTADGIQEGSLWQAIEKDGNLSNFASVLKACGFDKSLASSQVFTVFAPTNATFSAEEAAQLIAAYNEEKKTMSEEDNTIIKEFVKNHIAMYAHSIAPGVTDSLMLMNGKRVLFTDAKIHTSALQGESLNQHYENGLLFRVNEKIDYKPNIFEYLRKDADLDSLRSFMYDHHFYRKEFEPSLSVAGGIENGKTVYLDSVFSQVNELYSFLNARLVAEDSTYWMVSPTNEVWRQLIEEYEPYFNYTKTTVDRDSFVYTFPRLAIMEGAIFSKTLNRETALQDSAFSTMAERGEYRESYWGAPFLRYYQFGDGTGRSNHKPLQSGGVLADTEDVACSNGIVKKASKWNINPLNTFKQMIIVPATYRSNIQELSQDKNTSTKELEDIVDMTTLDIAPNSPYYNKVWGNEFMQFKPLRSDKDIFVRFNITNVLSNMPYDIYLVTAPILANDSNATNVQRLATKIDATICYLNADGKKDSTVLVSKKATTKDIVDYVNLTVDEQGNPKPFTFPCCTYALRESTPQVTLKIKTNVTNVEMRRSMFTRTMNIAYILLVPHGASWTDDENFYIEPHGDGETFTMSKYPDTDDNMNLEEQ